MSVGSLSFGRQPAVASWRNVQQQEAAADEGPLAAGHGAQDEEAAEAAAVSVACAL